MARVRIVKVPKALSGLEVKMQPGLYGTNGNNQFNKSAHLEAGKISQKPTEVRQTLEPVDREDANLEAEKGETAVINVSGMPAHFKIGGKRHSQGGTPLNLPDNSFIFSDTAKMKIKDPNILAQFGMKPKRGGYTPAEISKKYDVNKYRKVLADPNSEDLDRKTAEMMIANYNEKLAKLALAQESIKGFPQGIPVIAMPYMEAMQLDASAFVPDQAQEQLEEGSSPDADMGTSRYGSQVISQWNTKKYGGLPTAQNGKSYNEDPTQWEKDPSINIYYNKYKEALKSTDPQVLRQTADLLENTDVPGLFFMPNTPQNKLKDFANILRSNANKIETTGYSSGRKAAAEDEVAADMSLRKNVSDLFTKAYEYKKKAAAAGQTDVAIYFDKVLEDLHKLHPDYKGAQDTKGGWGSRLHRKPVYGATGTSEENTVKVPALYYNENEAKKINEILSSFTGLDPGTNKPIVERMDAEGKPVYKKGWDTLYKQIADNEKKLKDIELKKQAPKNPLIEGINKHVKDWKKPTEAEIDNLSEDEAGYLLRLLDKHKITFAEGGSTNLQKFGGGGNKDALKKRIKGEDTTKKDDKSGSTGGKGSAASSGVKLTPEEEAARQKTAETKPEKYVSDEDYEKLKKAYIKAARSSGAEVDDEGNIIKMGDVNKKTKEILEFQQLYHDLLPDEARRIIASEKDPTTKGKGLGHGEKYDLAANEDMMFGKRTKQYWQAVKKKPADKPADVTTKKEEKTPADRGPIERRPPVDLGKKTYAPWWLQDIVKTSGAAADLARVKRYLPWQATPEVRLPDATFYDPTRELAANAEQANIQTQGLAAFTGPQALSARSAQIQGQAMKNAADIMGKYNNMNVQIANQLNQERTGIMNQAAMNRANLNTQLFDKYTIANQQFDNAKNMARQNLRQSYIDAITNRAKTQALNTLYPNFYTDPITGGFVNKTGYANIHPTAPGSTEADEVEKLIKRFPGLTPDKAYDIIRKNKGASDESDASGYLKAQGYT